MIFEKIKSEGIAHNSYLIAAEGQAAVIDPRRDCEIYIELCKKNNLEISTIFETHRNEDFVIGSIELADRTGASIYHGKKFEFGYGKKVKEGDTFLFGSIEIEIIETPGHTDESISLLVKDKSVSDLALMVFTGDAIFAGDVGRIDLYGEKQRERMSGLLYDSIFNKIIPLGNHVIICPAHGKGSVCGGEISDREYTTIGYEKKTNKLLRKSKTQFINEKTKESHYRPPYFRKMEILNKNGPPLLKNLPILKPISIAKLKNFIANDSQIVDIRAPVNFAGSYIPKSINIWRKGLPMFAGWILKYDKPIVIVDDFNLDLDEVVRYLIRLGYDNIQGYLLGGFFSWEKSAEKSEKIDIWSVNDFRKKVNDESIYILDVRDEKSISKQGYIKNSHFLYVGDLPDNLKSVPKNKQILVYCDTGFKTSIASSILKKHSYPKVANLMGGFAAWENAGFSIEK